MQNYKPIYKPKLGLAGLEDPITGLRVYTICMHPGQKKAAIMAYTGAKLSRSSESIEDILSEVMLKVGGEKAGERISTIVNGYGHASVADMSHNFIQIERAPMVTAMRYFYLNAKQDGQERSTRFQNFSQPEYWTPQNFPDKKSEETYEMIIKKQIDDYNQLKDMTFESLENFFEVDTSNNAHKAALGARSFDTLRHLIPMGMRTNFCGIMSSRDWARYIGLMRGSNQEVEKILGEMLYVLLTGTPEMVGMGYVPDSDALIRYADANTAPFETIEKLKGYFSEALFSNIDLYRQGADEYPALESFLEHIGLITTGHSYNDLIDAKGNREILKHMGAAIFSSHNDRKQLGPIFQSGKIRISGVLDLGALKDFNRQRSLERFIPYLENNISPEALLKNNYMLCEYLTLDGLKRLKDMYVERFSETYTLIREFAKSCNNTEMIRYLLPHAHQTSYRMYGSFDDMMYVQNLRTRPGGHINYRMETYKWYENMMAINDTMEVFWGEFKLQKPNPSSAAEFVDRS